MSYVERDSLSYKTGYSEGYKASIEDFLSDLDSLPMEVIIWDSETKCHLQERLEMGKVTSGMVFMPEITRLKLKWEEKSK